MLSQFIKVTAITIEGNKRPTEFCYTNDKLMKYKTTAFWPAESGSIFRPIDVCYAISENEVAFLAKTDQQWYLLNTWDIKSWKNSWIKVPKN